MKQIALLLCILVAVVLSGCCGPAAFVGGVVGSGRLETREMDLSGFTRVQAGSAFAVDIKQADSFDVTVTVDDNLWENVDAFVSGDTLVLRLRPIIGIRRGTLRAKVSMPTLRGIELSGASRGTLTGFRTDESLSLHLSGASRLRGDIQAGDVRLEVSGASELELTGAGADLSGDGSGASTIDLAGFEVKDANLLLSGASKAYLNVSGRLDADLSGASRLEHSPEATLGRINTSGASTVRAR